MHGLSEHELLAGLVALALVLTFARGAGELARRIGQPEVVGELFAGVLLGPSVFGALVPALRQTLFLNTASSFFLSGLSWIGAIMLLLVAGMEVDLGILRKEARPAMLAAAGAVISSIIAGWAFATYVLGQTGTRGLFLGVVLSVTAVSVVAKIAMERGVMRRDFAQLTLAAGIATEVVVWLLVALVYSLRGHSVVLVGVRSLLFAVGFFVVMMTVGRSFTFWGMRRVRDAARIVKGQLTLVLVLAFVAAAITQALGLHALLGAFVFGVVLTQAPRANEELLDGLQSLTLSFFAPIFFVLAGMRVDILQLTSLPVVLMGLFLFAVATAVKVGFGALGARLGGHRGWEPALVGMGLNLKGGTDVVVAVVGTELGLLSSRAYTMYAVVAILTVFISPPILNFLESKTPPTREEEGRLEGEEAGRRSYLPSIERVLVPVEPRLFPALAASVLQGIAQSKHDQGQIFDITEFEVQDRSASTTSETTSDAQDRLSRAGDLKDVQLSHQHIEAPDSPAQILDASLGYDLIAIGAHPPQSDGGLSFGELADTLIDRAKADVLVAIDAHARNFDCSRVKRILVPTNGLEYSMAAGDIAGSLAEACDAEVVIFHAVQAKVDEHFSDDGAKRMEAASGIAQELDFRISRLGVACTQRVEAAHDPGEAVLHELERGDYQLVVLGGLDRGFDGRLYLGKSIDTVLARTNLPALLLVSHTDGSSRTE